LDFHSTFSCLKSFVKFAPPFCLLVVSLCSCAPLPRGSYFPNYPRHSEIPNQPETAIDGEWAAEGGLRIRISHGQAYTLNSNSEGVLKGSVLVKDIRPYAKGQYRCRKESYNTITRLIDFGPGEIFVTGPASLVLVASPNPKTRLFKPLLTF